MSPCYAVPSKVFLNLKLLSINYYRRKYFLPRVGSCAVHYFYHEIKAGGGRGGLVKYSIFLTSNVDFIIMGGFKEYLS